MRNGVDCAVDSACQTRRAQAFGRSPRGHHEIMYVLSTGCQWGYIPKDLPPKTTIFNYLDLWEYEGVIDRIHHALYVQCREMAGREASPTACVIDSQSVKSAEKG